MTGLLTGTGNWLTQHEEVVVRTSPADAPGYWAGAPSAVYDRDTRSYYLYYRLRRPRGMGRGYQARIARSPDGFEFEDILRIEGEELHSPSLERGFLIRKGGEWLLYLSYVHPATNQWQIDLVRASRIEDLDVSTAKPVLTPDAVGGHAVKDPVVLRQGPLWYMYVSYAPAALLDATGAESLHQSQDVFTTGLVRSHTGLAVSLDGEHYAWQGEVLGSSPEGWDSLVSRISGLMRSGEVYLAFYDGAADVTENYEERGGLAVTADLRHFYKLSSSLPWFQSAYGSARYVCSLTGPKGTLLYYEAATESGAHYLCARRITWEA